MSAFNAVAQIKPQFANSGDSDASPDGAPSQFLLLRGLESSVGEDVLAKGVTKLYKPNRDQVLPANASSKKNSAKVASTTGDANLGAKEGTLRRILLVRDRVTNESWRYGFAEFASIDVSITAGLVGLAKGQQDAQAAMIRFNSFEKFTISSKPVSVDYIHAGVFVPATTRSENVEQFTFSPLGNPTTKIMYWDEEAFVSELGVSTDPAASKAPSNNGRSAADLAAASAEAEGLAKSGKDNDTKFKKRKADSGGLAKSKKVLRDLPLSV